jgi:pescadillo protein
MGKLKKKGQEGAAKTYITRNQALKLLQLSLPDFRRLCILKGVYPREPRSKKKANKGSTANTTFYYTKDIRFLLHEPVLRTFREQKAFAKKLTRAIGKEDYTKAKDLQDHRPQYVLDHIVKERYPSFQDALADLDDALSMLFLFSNLPPVHQVHSETIRNCERLCAEFQHYVIRSKSLRKCFLSIKGIYYQAEIEGEKITWIVPYKFSQHVRTRCWNLLIQYRFRRMSISELC